VRDAIKREKKHCLTSSCFYFRRARTWNENRPDRLKNTVRHSGCWLLLLNAT